MRIVQIVLPGASEYERKSQRADFGALSPHHEVTTCSSADDVPSGDVAHIYGPRDLPAGLLRGFPLPYLTNSAIRRTRFFNRAYRAALHTISPLEGEGTTTVPEAVEDSYWRAEVQSPSGVREPRVAGVFGATCRPGVRNAVEQTAARLQRFRDDVIFHLFDSVPTPADLADVDIWVDPTPDSADFDGMVAEAIVCGLTVVASRTPINSRRLENGRIGFLVPPADPNELTHAILTALFKPEVGQARIDAARQTASKFRPRQRLRVLAQLYGALNP